jgi:hypothetical protein
MKTGVLIFVLSVVLFSGVTSCKKPAGSGGNSSIHGKVWAKDYPTLEEYASVDHDVYIIYGDDLSYGDRVRTNYDGIFEFKYLRKGKYKIYCYSKALNSLQDSAVFVDVEITSNKQEVETPNMNVND